MNVTVVIVCAMIAVMFVGVIALSRVSKEELPEDTYNQCLKITFAYTHSTADVERLCSHLKDKGKPSVYG